MTTSAPRIVRLTCIDALTVAAEGGKAEIAKPMHGLGSGVFEIVLPYRGDAFQKKSTIGIRTPKRVIELVRKRMQRLGVVL